MYTHTDTHTPTTLDPKVSILCNGKALGTF